MYNMLYSKLEKEPASVIPSNIYSASYRGTSCSFCIFCI